MWVVCMGKSFLLYFLAWVILYPVVSLGYLLITTTGVHWPFFWWGCEESGSKLQLCNTDQFTWWLQGFWFNYLQKHSSCLCALRWWDDKCLETNISHFFFLLQDNELATSFIFWISVSILKFCLCIHWNLDFIKDVTD